MNRILSTFTMNDSSESVRVGLWVSTSAMISDHPFAGIGWGAYQYVYPQYNYYIADPNITIYHAHNIYLNYAAEVGIVGALAFFWYFFGTMFISFGVSENGAEKWLREHIEKIFESSAFLQEIANFLDKRLEFFSDTFINLFRNKKPRLKLKKGRKKSRDLVHNEDLTFSEHTRKKFADSDKNIDETAAEEEIDDKKSVDWNDITKIDDQKFLEGIKLGIALAFLSIALNGFTDDLLFNIPSSMLMWLLGALSAAIYLMPEENFGSNKRRRRI